MPLPVPPNLVLRPINWDRREWGEEPDDMPEATSRGKLADVKTLTYQGSGRVERHPLKANEAMVCLDAAGQRNPMIRASPMEAGDVARQGVPTFDPSIWIEADSGVRPAAVEDLPAGDLVRDRPGLDVPANDLLGRQGRNAARSYSFVAQSGVASGPAPSLMNAAPIRTDGSRRR